MGLHEYMRSDERVDNLPGDRLDVPQQLGLLIAGQSVPPSQNMILAAGFEGFQTVFVPVWHIGHGNLGVSFPANRRPVAPVTREQAPHRRHSCGLDPASGPNDSGAPGWVQVTGRSLSDDLSRRNFFFSRHLRFTSFGESARTINVYKTTNGVASGRVRAALLY
jgi:hypothetical protein